MDLEVQYLSSPVALRLLFSGIPYPMRIQSAIYATHALAERVRALLMLSAASPSDGLYCFTQQGNDDATFYAGVYGADADSETDVWRNVTLALADGQPEHMSPLRVMEMVQSARLTGGPASPIARA